MSIRPAITFAAARPHSPPSAELRGDPSRVLPIDFFFRSLSTLRRSTVRCESCRMGRRHGSVCVRQGGRRRRVRPGRQALRISTACRATRSDLLLRGRPCSRSTIPRRSSRRDHSLAPGRNRETRAAERADTQSKSAASAASTLATEFAHYSSALSTAVRALWGCTRSHDQLNTGGSCSSIRRSSSPVQLAVDPGHQLRSSIRRVGRLRHESIRRFARCVPTVACCGPGCQRCSTVEEADSLAILFPRGARADRRCATATAALRDRPRSPAIEKALLGISREQRPIVAPRAAAVPSCADERGYAGPQDSGDQRVRASDRDHGSALSPGGHRHVPSIG